MATTVTFGCMKGPLAVIRTGPKSSTETPVPLKKGAIFTPEINPRTSMRSFLMSAFPSSEMELAPFLIMNLFRSSTFCGERTARQVKSSDRESMA